MYTIKEELPDIRKVVMFSPWSGDDDWVISFEDFLALGSDVSDQAFEERARDTTLLS